ncbi:MAG: HcpA family protein, partial [Bradyrhizobium sp.]|nr:HcpA family protein [Bradyrhizobium sp.]
MTLLRLTYMLAVIAAATTAAHAQISLTPPTLQQPPAEKPKPAERPAEKAADKPKPPAVTKKPAPAPAPTAKPAAPAPVASPQPPQPAATDPNVDLVYGAYQRGQYKTAFDLATPRAQAGDPKA